VRKLIRLSPIVLVALACADGRPSDSTSAAGDTKTAPVKTAAASSVPFRVPALSEITDTLLLKSVVRGRAILDATHDSLPDNVGNALRCTSCHFSGGTEKNSMSWIGTYARYPQYRARTGRVDVIEDRINDCFRRSMNGRELDSHSQAMRDIVAYIAFLSRGIPGGAQVKESALPKIAKLAGDSSHGATLFAARCARCHGTSGEGTKIAPPLWGPRSYNIGAGMARDGAFAAFVHQLMPRDSARTRSEQDAYDLAAYVNSRPRPDYRGKENDWPFGGAPDDIAYPVKSAKGSAPPAAK